MMAKTTDPLVVAQSIMKTFRVLPTVPMAASRAIQLLNESEVDMAAVADLLLSDQVMAARIIRVVNSPLYLLLQEISSVRQALIYLGPQRVFEIILTSCFLELTDTQGRSPLSMQCCWSHAFGVGLLARELAADEDASVLDDVYLAGVLHDVGEVILGQQRRDEFLRVLVLSLEREISLYDAEMEVFGTSHAHVGGLLAEQWRFPAVYVDAIRNHHSENICQTPVITRLVHIADRICHDVGLTCHHKGAVQREGGVFASELQQIEQDFVELGLKPPGNLKATLKDLVLKVQQTVDALYG